MVSIYLTSSNVESIGCLRIWSPQLEKLEEVKRRSSYEWQSRQRNLWQKLNKEVKISIWSMEIWCFTMYVHGLILFLSTFHPSEGHHPKITRHWSTKRIIWLKLATTSLPDVFCQKWQDVCLVWFLHSFGSDVLFQLGSDDTNMHKGCWGYTLIETKLSTLAMHHKIEGLS